MKRFRKVILVVATATLLFVLWKINPSEVWRYLVQVGWGMALIFAQEIVAHGFNALAWRFAFTRDSRAAYSLGELLKLRVSGDGVNYLTPSATIAGEFIRAVSLNESQTAEVRYASVAVAKFTQALAQVFFILAGLAFMMISPNPIILQYPAVIYGFAGTLLGALSLLAIAGVLTWKRLCANGKTQSDGQDADAPKSWISAMGDVPRQCLSFCVNHSGRFALSILFFMLGYAWGAFEAYWICAFLGVPVTVKTAFIIEVLSNFIDSIMFMVPAKVGTQEGGKTAIFIGLGMPAGAGFAFGVVRHIRELVWACAGLALCYSRKTPGTPPAAVQRPNIVGNPAPESMVLPLR